MARTLTGRPVGRPREFDENEVLAAAWLYSITLLPALLSVLPLRVRQTKGTEWSQRAMDRS